MAVNKYLNLDVFTIYDNLIKGVISQTAENVESKLSDNISEIKTTTDSNKESIESINDNTTGVLAQSKIYTDANTDIIENKIGLLDKLETVEKSSLVKAINEIKSLDEETKKTSKVTVDTGTITEGYLKSYTFKQNDTTIGTVDIPKDLVVESGVVETNPDGQDKGTYLVLTLANTTSDKVYINVGTLVDIYTEQKNATQIQLTVNNSTREISATIVDGSVNSTALADSAVTTVKIADGNVTKAKLATDVQTSLGKADSAIQESDITSLRTDVEANKTSLAEGGATYKAISAAQSTADGAVARIDALEVKVGDGFEAITEAEINELFNI